MTQLFCMTQPSPDPHNPTFFATPLLPLPITPSSSRSSSVISLVLAASSVVPCKGQGPQVQAAVR